MHKRTRTGLAVAAGVLLFLSLPPARLWFLTLPAIAILGLLLARATPRQGFSAGWWTGAVATMGVGAWLPATMEHFTSQPESTRVLCWLLLGAWTGLSWGLAGFLAARFGKTLGVPLGAALGLLLAERWGPTIFSYPLAVALVDAPWLAQSGDLAGVSGLGALLLALAVAAADALSQRRRTRALTVCLALTAACTVYGAVRGPMVARARAAAPRLAVGLVQPSIGAAERWEDAERAQILKRLQEMTASLYGQKPDLIIWHEGAYPYPLAHDARTATPPALTVENAPPLLFGAQTRDAAGGLYNSAFVRAPDGTLSEPVDKRARVPFGEYIPGLAWSSWLRRALPRVEGLRAGARPELLAAAGRTIGVLNCLEDILPQSGAEVASADLLVNLTNDAWFDGAEGAQHLTQARWRAIETRRDLVRAVNNGQTGHVDALGHVVAAMPQGLPSTLLVTPRVASGVRALAPWTIPAEPWLALVVLAGALAVELRRRRATR